MSDLTASAIAMEHETSVDKKHGDAKKGKHGPGASLDLDELRELADLVIERGFTDFEFENANIRVRLSRMGQPAQPAAFQPQAVPQIAAPAPQPAVPASAPEEAPAADGDAALHKIVSPIVGTFYRAPGPDKEPFVKEGSVVNPNTVVCIVEAMKLMNEIEAEVSGEIVRIYVENGQPVEYGQPLFGVKK